MSSYEDGNNNFLNHMNINLESKYSYEKYSQ